MKIRFIQTLSCPGYAFKSGEEHDVDEAFATAHIASGVCVAVEPVKAAKTPSPAKLTKAESKTPESK